MKAKELAAILLKNPEAEVLHYEYTGGDTPLLKINKTELFAKDEQILCGNSIYEDDGSKWINNKNRLKTDVIILRNDRNKK